MARNEGNRIVPTSLFECLTWKQAVRVACQCGHFNHFDPAGLWWHFHRKGWSDEFRDAREHFYCRPCRIAGGVLVRPVSIEPCIHWPIVTLPVPGEREWKRAIARMRG
ncbi:hypothetical protein SAMN05518849_101566 [Sphingobium sp. AP50]|uniref:hypothetical protein n=1 Tax=Sphingobium sp. AP50 TaxID=1884369 RepID=UPI0008CE92C6|nr:hypothetical protein [Sphingobium sp. AP50]SEI68961.1 hypothetical protein SAMN05518849_101566 [Sphingobium sp. AP50]